VRLTWQGIVGAVAGAAVLGAVIAGGAYVGKTVAEKKATEAPTPTPSVAAPAQPTPTPAPTTASPSASPSPIRTPAARQPAPRTLRNLRNVLPEITLQVPAGAGCPAATVRFDAAGGGSSGGVDYRMTDEPGSDYGDLTGDGHEELMLPVICGDSPGTLLVIAATGPTTYAVRAALTRPATIARTEIRGQRLRLYGPAGKVLAVYRLAGNRLVRTSS
jgi:hypothetical protein